MFQPTAQFCAANHLPYPAPLNAYDPFEFTFKGLEDTLSAILARSAGVVDAKSLKSLVTCGGHDHFASENRIACVMIPVLFSPSNAIKMGALLKKLAQKTGKNIPATFLFGQGLSYTMDEGKTHEAIATLSNQGFSIGLLATLDQDITAESLQDSIRRDLSAITSTTHRNVSTLGYHSLGITTQRTHALDKAIQHDLSILGVTSLLSEFFQDPTVAICATRHGLYRKGHPLDLITDDKRVVVLQLPSDWYSDTPSTPIEKIWSLPEAGPAVARAYQDLLGQPIYGATATYESKSRTPQGQPKVLRSGEKTQGHHSKQDSGGLRLGGR